MRIVRQVLTKFLGKVKHAAEQQLDNKQEGLVMARGNLAETVPKVHQYG